MQYFVYFQNREFVLIKEKQYIQPTSKYSSRFTQKKEKKKDQDNNKNNPSSHDLI